MADAGWQVFVHTVGKTQFPKKETVCVGEEKCLEYERDQNWNTSGTLSGFCYRGNFQRYEKSG